MLSKDVESLLNDIGSGTLNESAIKGRLARIQEQAEAQDAEIEKIKAELKQAEKRITSLELELHEQKPVEQGERLEEGAEKILKLLFDDAIEDIDYVGVMANALGMIKGVVQYHCDALYEAEFLGYTGPERFHLYPKGRAYVVKYLMKD